MSSPDDFQHWANVLVERECNAVWDNNVGQPLQDFIHGHFSRLEGTELTSIDMSELNPFFEREFPSFLNDLAELEPLGEDVQSEYVRDCTEYLARVVCLTRGDCGQTGIRRSINFGRLSRNQVLERLFMSIKRAALSSLRNRDGYFMRYEKRRAAAKRLAILDAFVRRTPERMAQYTAYIYSGRLRSVTVADVRVALQSSLEAVIGSFDFDYSNPLATVGQYNSDRMTFYDLGDHFLEFANAIINSRDQILNEMIATYLTIPASQPIVDRYLRQQLAERTPSTHTGSVQQSLPAPQTTTTSAESSGRSINSPQQGSMSGARNRRARIRDRVREMSSNFRGLFRSGRRGETDQPPAQAQTYPNCPGIYVPPPRDPNVPPVTAVASELVENVQEATTTNSHDATENIVDALGATSITDAIEQPVGTGEPVTDNAEEPSVTGEPVTECPSAGNATDENANTVNDPTTGEGNSTGTSAAPAVVSTPSYPNCPGIFHCGPSGQN
ncbi:hypothetical protein F5884DRAFT_850442 [Xylogone sp. PMI_703]|nr:hypothetical protein F5884DRAFT_850442 [Xylogone sp. PMI_703]